MLDPLRASSRIRDEYRRYLLSTFPLGRGDLRREFEARLGGDFELTKGPFLEASPPFMAGASVRDLMREGVLSDGFERLAKSFPIDRPLYAHQETAVRKAVSHRRNLLISTGTGSGKTECFLLPIIDGLLREAREGTLSQPGVRALLLYPDERAGERPAQAAPSTACPDALADLRPLRRGDEAYRQGG